MKFHPLCEAYPEMPAADFKLLVEDMRANGYDHRFPIFMWKGLGVEGRSRYKASQEAGVTPSIVDLPDDTDVEAFIVRANEHRRHLTVEWLTAKRSERIARVAGKRAAGASTRQIAEEEGISQPQVRRDLEAATETGGVSVETPDGKVTGKDGKKREAIAPPAHAIRCERCNRVGGDGKNCAACQELRKAAGRGTYKPRTHKPPKNGSPVWNIKEFLAPFGQIKRAIDDMARSHGLVNKNNTIKETPEIAALHRLINEFKVQFGKTHRQLIKEVNS